MVQKFSFNFPPMKGLENFTVQEQLAHISQETGECIAAFYDGDEYDIVSEAMDIIHAVETLLRMKGIVGDKADELRNTVEHKNRIRGYYGEQ